MLVDPITNTKHIKKLKAHLSNQPRDYALFICGINLAFRASDLLSLNAGQVRKLRSGSDLTLGESKTGKKRRVAINEDVFKAIQRLLASEEFKDEDPLFRGSKRKTRLTVETYGRLVKSWCKAIGIEHGNFSSHSLRKTWGYQHRTKHNVGIEVLQQAFNHASPKITMSYIGIQPEEIRRLYLKKL